MELIERVERLENKVDDINVRLAKLETRSENFATKTDVSEAKASIIMWVVAAIFLAQLLPMFKDYLTAAHNQPTQIQQK